MEEHMHHHMANQSAVGGGGGEGGGHQHEHHHHGARETLEGHAMFGLLFVISGLVATFSITLRFFVYKLRGGHKFHNSTLCFPKRGGILPPCETLVKMFVLYLGMILEFVTGEGDMHNQHHITMLFFFSLHGCFEILYHYRIRGLPKGLDYFTAALGFGIEALLFSYHLGGRDPFNTILHIFLRNSILACMVAALAEAYFIYSPLFGLLRAGGCLLQGFWLITLGFILYPAPKVQLDVVHEMPMAVSLWFCWHIAGVLVLQCLLGAAVYLRVKAKTSTPYAKSKSKADWNDDDEEIVRLRDLE